MTTTPEPTELTDSATVPRPRDKAEEATPVDDEPAPEEKAAETSITIKSDEPIKATVSRFGPLGKPIDRRSPFFIGFTGGLGLLLAWATYQAVLNVWSILLLIGVAAFLAIGLNPAVVQLQRLRIPRGLAVAIVALGVFGFIGTLVWALVPPAVDQTTDFLNHREKYVDELSEKKWIKDLDEKYGLLEKIKGSGDEIDTDTVMSTASKVAGGIGLVLTSLFNIVTCLILTLYFMVAFERLKAGAYKLVPASRRERAQLLGDEIIARIGRYMSGAIVIAAIAGVCSFIFMEFMGIPFAFALALVVALTDLIPQIGAMLGAVIVTIVAFFVSVPVGLATLAFFIAYQQVENWIVYPKVMKRAVNVSDLAAILSALIGAALLGVVGVLLAVPACAVIQLLVREVVFPRQEAN